MGGSIIPLYGGPAIAPSPLPIRGTRPQRELLAAWLLVLLEGGASYGYDLRRELDARELSVDPSALYRTLRGLERDGWVQSRWMKAETGPRRRFYRLTASGRRNLDEMAVVIRTRRDVHDAFLRAHEIAVGQRRAGSRQRGGDGGDDPPQTPNGAAIEADATAAAAAASAPAAATVAAAASAPDGAAAVAGTD